MTRETAEWAGGILGPVNLPGEACPYPAGAGQPEHGEWGLRLSPDDVTGALFFLGAAAATADPHLYRQRAGEFARSRVDRLGEGVVLY